MIIPVVLRRSHGLILAFDVNVNSSFRYYIPTHGVCYLLCLLSFALFLFPRFIISTKYIYRLSIR
jgi:hypothetical protein